MICLWESINSISSLNFILSIHRYLVNSKLQWLINGFYCVSSERVPKPSCVACQDASAREEIPSFRYMDLI